MNSTNQPNYFYRELDKKNKQIQELKDRVNTLLDEKNLLNKLVQELRENNHQLSIKNEQENKKLDSEVNNKMGELYEIIKSLQRENQIIKDKLNKQDEFEKNFNETVTNKLTQAQRKVDNLSVLNVIKDNVINEYQDFVNQLNEIVGKKFNFILNFSNDDIDIYSKNFNKIKNKVFEHLKYENYHRPYIDPIPKDIQEDLILINNNKSDHRLRKEFSNISEIPKNNNDSGMIIKSLKSPPEKKLYKSTLPLKKKKRKIPLEEKCVNMKSCNCRFKEYNTNNYKPDHFSSFRSTNYSRRTNSNYGLRTPPRDSD